MGQMFCLFMPVIIAAAPGDSNTFLVDSITFFQHRFLHRNKIITEIFFDFKNERFIKASILHFMNDNFKRL